MTDSALIAEISNVNGCDKLIEMKLTESTADNQYKKRSECGAHTSSWAIQNPLDYDINFED